MKKALAWMLSFALALPVGLPPAEYNTACISVQAANTDTDFVIEDGTRLVKYNGKETGSITIPAQITEIADGCFMGHTELVSVAFPEELCIIGMAAFTGCINLRTAEIPDSVITLKAGAFQLCTALTEVRLSANLQTLETAAFSSCTALEKVYAGKALTRIEDSVFFGCANLEYLELPDTVQYIDRTAFSGCNAFNAAHTADGAFIVNNILIQGTADTTVYHVPDGIVSIVNSAFKNSRTFELVCPDSLQYIGKNALSDCPNLRILTVPASIAQIAAQENCSLTDICGTPGTAAEQFALENGITFHDVSTPVKRGDMTLDYTKDGWSFGNSGEVFGSGYYLHDADRQYLADLGIDAGKYDDKAWSGSCGGLSVTVILAKNGFFTPNQLQTDARTLSDADASEAVQSLINYYQCMQNEIAVAQPQETKAQKIWRMQHIAKNIPNGESPFLLTFKTGSGGFHAAVGYGYESGSWQFEGKSYDARILTWDSNFPDALNDTSCVYFDSETFDYCIPHYNVDSADGTGEINTVCNDLAVLNAHPYPFALHYDSGDLNLDGAVSVADAVLLSKHLTTHSRLSGSQLLLADLSGDGKVNAVDLTLLKRIL